MQIVSAREFRTNQSTVLRRALKGETTLLTSKLGTFKITPVTEDDFHTSRILDGMREVKMIEAGKLKGYTVEELFDGI